MRVVDTKEVILRGLKLRCPACGLAPIYHHGFRINTRCSSCGLPFIREQGYFVGAVYINVLMTEAILFGVYLFCLFVLASVGKGLIITLCVLAIVFPLVFFPFTRSLWISIDYIIDPVRKMRS